MNFFKTNVPYILSFILGFCIATYIYVWHFDEISEMEMIQASAIWVFLVSFGGFGIYAYNKIHQSGSVKALFVGKTENPVVAAITGALVCGSLLTVILLSFS